MMCQFLVLIVTVNGIEACCSTKRLLVFAIKVKFMPSVGESVILSCLQVKKQNVGIGIGSTIEVVSIKDSVLETIVSEGVSVELLQLNVITSPPNEVILTALYFTGIGVGAGGGRLISHVQLVTPSRLAPSKLFA